MTAIIVTVCVLVILALFFTMYNSGTKSGFNFGNIDATDLAHNITYREPQGEVFSSLLPSILKSHF